MRLKIWQKIALMLFIMGVGATAMIGYLMYTRKTVTVDFAKKERQGVEYIVPAKRLLMDVIEYRDATIVLLSGNAFQSGKIVSLQPVIDGDIRAVEAVDQKLGKTLDTKKAFDAIQRDWQGLKGKQPGENPDLSKQIVTDTISLISHVGDTSNLILDPDLDSYYLMATVVVQLPVMLDDLGNLRTLGAGIATRKVATLDEKLQVSSSLGRLDLNLDSIKKGIKTASDFNPALAPRVSPSLNNAVLETTSFADLINQMLLKAGNIGIAPNEYFSMGTKPLDQASKLYDSSLSNLDNLLQKRVAKFSRDMNYILAIIAAAIVFAILLVTFIARTTTGQINSILDVFDSVRRGNYASRAKVASTDELGSIASSLNNVLDETVTLVQSREERDSIQRSVRKLLEEVSGVAEGDLTQEAEVTADMTGALADSFNFMINELRQIIGDVQGATLQVASSAEEAKSTMEILNKGSESQTVQIIDTSAAIDEMAASIKQVSENAAISAAVAEQARGSAKHGGETVEKTMKGMNSIRDQVQETAKRIKRLGESSQEIGEITQLIGDIADRTSILALNASIQAAMAGDAGRGFAVVAQEIERLAERSTEATKRINTLIKTIQTETNEAVAAMEDTTHEVVNGSALANEAGRALVEIDEVSNKLAELIQSISIAAQRQAQGSEAVAQAMGDISQITQVASAGTRQAAMSISSLVTLAESLRGSVTRFKLPNGSGNGQKRSALQ